MKPEAPAERATFGEMIPAPEISSTRVSGLTWWISSQTSAPDSVPSSMSTSATSGFTLRQTCDRLGAGGGGEAALDPALALEQQAEAPLDDVVVVDDEDAQAARLGGHRTPHRDDEADPPAVPAGGAELDQALVAQRFEGGEPQAEAAAAGGAAVAGAVVLDREGEGLAVGGDRGRRLALGCAWRSALRSASFEDQLGDRLEVGGHLDPVGPVDPQLRAALGQAVEQLAEAGLGRAGRGCSSGRVSARAQVGDDRAQLLLAAPPLRLR